MFSAAPAPPPSTLQNLHLLGRRSPSGRGRNPNIKHQNLPEGLPLQIRPQLRENFQISPCLSRSCESVIVRLLFFCFSLSSFAKTPPPLRKMCVIFKRKERLISQQAARQVCTNVDQVRFLPWWAEAYLSECTEGLGLVFPLSATTCLGAASAAWENSRSEKCLAQRISLARPGVPAWNTKE